MDISTTVWPLKTTSGLVGFFKMAAAATLDFKNSEMLRVKRVNMHHLVKFRAIAQTVAEIWRFSTFPR